MNDCKKQLDVLSLLEALQKISSQDKASIILSVLTPLEAEIATIFLEKKVAMSTYEVKKALIAKWFKMVLDKVDKVKFLDNKIKKAVEKNSTSSIPVTLFSESYFPGKFVVDVSTLITAFSGFNVNFKEMDLRNEKSLVDLQKNILRKLRVAVPSYRRIESNLRALVTCGLLVYFETEGGKSKGVYALNPKVTEKLE